MNKVLILITYKYETQISLYVKKVSNLDEVYEILSNYWKEEDIDIISKAFYTAYEMLNGKLEGEKAYFNVVDGLLIKVRKS